MTMIIYEPVPYGKRITCECENEECWHQIEVEGDGFFYKHDGTDHTHEQYEDDFTFPEGFVICQAKEIEPAMDEDTMRSYLHDSFKFFGMKLPDWIVKMVLPAMERERSFYELELDRIREKCKQAIREDRAKHGADNKAV